MQTRKLTPGAFALTAIFWCATVELTSSSTVTPQISYLLTNEVSDDRATQVIHTAFDESYTRQPQEEAAWQSILRTQQKFMNKQITALARDMEALGPTANHCELRKLFAYYLAGNQKASAQDDSIIVSTGTKGLARTQARGRKIACYLRKVQANAHYSPHAKTPSAEGIARRQAHKASERYTTAPFLSIPADLTKMLISIRENANIDYAQALKELRKAQAGPLANPSNLDAAHSLDRKIARLTRQAKQAKTKQDLNRIANLRVSVLSQRQALLNGSKHARRGLFGRLKRFFGVIDLEGSSKKVVASTPQRRRNQSGPALPHAPAAKSRNL
jgi:hypothetical protein